MSKAAFVEQGQHGQAITERMTDAELVAFLEWAVPQLGLRWEGLRNFRRTVRKRLARRMSSLGLATLEAYRALLERDRTEWSRLDAMCRVTISRLYRDRAMYERLATEILPERARVAIREKRDVVRVWSAGCASGEEPYSIAIAWHVDVAPHFPGVSLEVVATDVGEEVIARASRATYEEGSVRELEARLRAAALLEEGAMFRVRPELRRYVTFRCEDLRKVMPDGPFDLVMCRNLLLTYIDDERQGELLDRIVSRLAPAGLLVVGRRERMPDGAIPRAGLSPRGDGIFAVSG